MRIYLVHTTRFYSVPEFEPSEYLLSLLEGNDTAIEELRRLIPKRVGEEYTIEAWPSLIKAKARVGSLSKKLKEAGDESRMVRLVFPPFDVPRNLEGVLEAVRIAGYTGSHCIEEVLDFAEAEMKEQMEAGYGDEE